MKKQVSCQHDPGALPSLLCWFLGLVWFTQNTRRDRDTLSTDVRAQIHTHDTTQPNRMHAEVRCSDAAIVHMRPIHPPPRHTPSPSLALQCSAPPKGSPFSACVMRGPTLGRRTEVDTGQFVNPDTHFMRCLYKKEVDADDSGRQRPKGRVGWT